MNDLPSLDNSQKTTAVAVVKEMNHGDCGECKQMLTLEAHQEEISNRANARKEAIVKTTAEFKDFIERVGLHKFTQIFVDAHAHQTYVVDVHEFLSHHDTEEEQTEMKKISDFYARERLAFDLTFYSRYMSKLSVDRVAATLANIDEVDICQALLDKIRAGIQSIDEHERMSKQMQEWQGDDNNGPKRASSAFLYFAADRRPQLMKEHPERELGELTSTISFEWKEMSERDKSAYNDLAKADKERYARECGDMLAAAAACNE